MASFPQRSSYLYIIFSLSIIILLLTTAFVSLFSIRSCNDVWWHLKSGQIITEARSLPETDVFTIEGDQYEWVNHEWLAQVIFYGVFQVGNESFRVLTVFKTLLLAIALLILYYFLYKDTNRNPVIPLFACLWALWLSKHTIYIRPPMFTYIFFILFHILLSR